MGPFSKENNACQTELGEVEGQTGMAIAPEVVFHEMQRAPGTLSLPVWPPKAHLSAF